MSHAVEGPREEHRRRRPLWLLLLLGLLGLLLLSLLLTRFGGDDSTTATTPGGAGSTSAGAGAGVGTSPGASVSPSAAATTAGATSASPSESTSASASTTAGGEGAGAGAGAGGTLTAGGESVLSDGGGDPASVLAAQVGKPAEASGVLVQSVPADEGFWVGTSETDRAWVQLTGDAGESAYQVKKGDRVQFKGDVVDHGAGFAKEVGVSAADGAQQLTTQKAHIEVAKGSVELSD